MKIKKQKAINKAERIAAKKELVIQISTALQSLIGNYTASNKKIEKLIEKNAKQLVKKLPKLKTPLPSVVAQPQSETTKTPQAKVKGTASKTESTETKA